jgi:hypothetical protein
MAASKAALAADTRPSAHSVHPRSQCASANAGSSASDRRSADFAAAWSPRANRALPRNLSARAAAAGASIAAVLPPGRAFCVGGALHRCVSEMRILLTVIK